LTVEDNPGKSDKYCCLMSEKNKAVLQWYQKPRETEGKETDEGSLSNFIVPVERREIISMKAAE